MRNLKYLIFIIISLFSVQTFAAIRWSLTNVAADAIYSSASSACRAALDKNDTRFQAYQVTDTSCRGWFDQSDTLVYYYMHDVNPVSCPNSGYPVPTYFDSGSPIPLRVCKANPDGTFCVYDATNRLQNNLLSITK